MSVFVTGGAGFIGSHTCVELLSAGYSVVIADNLSNSSQTAVKRVEQITGKRIPFYCVDLRDEARLEQIFNEQEIDTVVHFAGLKAVGESVAIPLAYYENNIGGTVSLCKVMQAHSCKNIIFSSSATVYGESNQPPFSESSPKGACTNPYGWTKWMIEQILTDLHTADSDWNVTLLRYFNPIGAHESGLIGENPKGTPNNLLPYVAQVAAGKREYVSVFGADYDTPDGTGMRDYIHVVDLAAGHVAALRHMGGLQIYNLGTGRAYSVLEVIRAFEQACHCRIPYRIMPRRPGDIASGYSNSEKAGRELGWKANYDLYRMCEDAWRWQVKNPDGYQEA